MVIVPDLVETSPSPTLPTRYNTRFGGFRSNRMVVDLGSQKCWMLGPRFLVMMVWLTSQKYAPPAHVVPFQMWSF